ncbi:MAG: hypothetical protein Kow00127_09780 [Bacteroidales bacterium]
MTLRIRVISVLLALMGSLAGTTTIVAQTGTDTLLSAGQVQSILPPLDTLINHALGHSGTYRYYMTEIGLQEELLRKQHKNWFDYISVDAGIGYGMFDQLYMNQFSYDYQYNLLTNAKRVDYKAGVTAKIPLSALINRPNDINIARLNVNKARMQAEQSREAITQQVIELYFATLTAYKTMTIRGNQLQAAELELKKAEKDFIDGKLSFNNFSVTARNLDKSRIEVNESVNKFLELVTKLEYITGMNLRTVRL